MLLSQYEPKMSMTTSSPTQSHLLQPTYQSQSMSEIHIPISELHFPPTISTDGNSMANETALGGESQISLIADTQKKKPNVSNHLR